MSASDHLGPQFKDHVRVFRGLLSTSPDKIDRNNLGIWWSDYEPMARGLATNTDDDDILDPYARPTHGSVIEALVHKKDFSSRDLMVKKGAPIHVVGVHYYTYDHEEDSIDHEYSENRTFNSQA